MQELLTVRGLTRRYDRFTILIFRFLMAASWD